MKNIKRLNILIYTLILLFSLTSCSFIFNANNNYETISRTTTTNRNYKHCNYHVVGLSESDQENANLSFIAYENENYDEIVNQEFEVKGYRYLGLFKTNTPDYNYTQHKYINLVDEYYLKYNYGEIDVYVIFNAETYRVFYSDEFIYESNGIAYYERTLSDLESHLHTPKIDYYDFDGTWTLTIVSNPNVSFSSYNDLLDSEYGYEDILVTPNATIKDIKKTGTINLDGEFDNIEFEFQTGSFDEVDVITYLESLNIEIPEKDGYTSTLVTTSFTPIEYTSQNLTINVSYIPIEYTINLSCAFTGTKGSHLEFTSSMKYTVEDNNISLSELDLLDENAKKVLKFEYWIDNDTNERIDTIVTSSIKDYNLKASLSLINYQIQVIGHVKEYSNQNNSADAFIAEKIITFNDFNIDNNFDLVSYGTELRENAGEKNIIFTKEVSNDVIYFKVGYDYKTYNTANGYGLSYTLLDENTHIINLSLSTLAFKTQYFNMIIYLDDEVLFQRTNCRMSDVNNIFKSYGDGLSWSYGTHNWTTYDFKSINSIDGAELKNIYDVFSAYVVNDTVHVNLITKKYEVEYVLPEGWTTTNETVLTNKLPYYDLLDPVSSTGNGKFYGWALSPDSTDYVTSYRTSDYIINYELTEEEGVANYNVRTLYAIAEFPKAKLVFHYGNGMEDVEQYLYLGDVEYYIDAFFNDDKIIRDWYREEGLINKISNPINISELEGTIDLYPKWENTKYLVGFNSKASNLDCDFSDMIISYYTNKGFETAKKDGIVYVLYTIDKLPQVPLLENPGNDQNSIYAYFDGWDGLYRSGEIDESLQNKYIEDAPVLTPKFTIYTLYEDGLYLRLMVYKSSYGVTTSNDISGARKVFVDDGNKFTPGVSAAISYFGLNYLHAKATAYFNCTDKTIPEFYLCNSNPDVNNETYWVSASDSNAYNGNYRKYNYANFQTLGNSSGAQTLTLNITSYTSRTVYLIISQHNSKKAGGGTDVYNPQTNVTITYEITAAKLK